MTTKRKLFVREYLVDFNATQAAIRAGYAEKTANRTGHKLLTFADVQHAVTQAVSDILGDRDEEIARIYRELASIAYGPESSEQAKLRALELMGKYQRMFQDSAVQINAAGPVQVNVAFIDQGEEGGE